jgi:hypothetical protein
VSLLSVGLLPVRALGKVPVTSRLRGPIPQASARSVLPVDSIGVSVTVFVAHAQHRFSLLFEPGGASREFRLVSSSVDFPSSSYVWIVVRTYPGYILESLDQKTQGFMV